MLGVGGGDQLGEVARVLFLDALLEVVAAQVEGGEFRLELVDLLAAAGALVLDGLGAVVPGGGLLVQVLDGGGGGAQDLATAFALLELGREGLAAVLEVDLEAEGLVAAVGGLLLETLAAALQLGHVLAQV